MSKSPIWLAPYPDMPGFTCNGGDFGLMLSKPIYHLEHLRTRADFYSVRWKTHHAVVESMEQCAQTTEYYAALLPTLIDDHIVPLASQEIEHGLANRAVMEPQSPTKPPSSTMIAVRLDATTYHLFAGGVWSVLSSIASAHWFAEQYCTNLSRAARDIHSDLSHKDVVPNLLDYLAAFSEAFEQRAQEWEKRRKCASKHESSAVWHRDRHNHKSFISNFLIDCRAEPKTLYFSYVNEFGLPDKQYSVEHILEDGLALKECLCGLAVDVMEFSFWLLEKYGITQLIEREKEFRSQNPRPADEHAPRHVWVGPLERQKKNP